MGFNGDFNGDLIALNEFLMGFQWRFNEF